MGRSPLCTHTAWGRWIICIIVVLGQSKFADSRPTNQFVNFEICYNISKRLVDVVMDSLTHVQKINSDFNCSYTSVALKYDKNVLNTLSECLPQTCICSNITKLVADKDKCLMAIHSDLKTSRSDLQGVNVTLNMAIEEMMGPLKMYDDKRDRKEKRTSHSELNQKVRQCASILKFQRRAITISRIFSYLKDESSKPHNY